MEKPFLIVCVPVYSRAFKGLCDLSCSAGFLAEYLRKGFVVHSGLLLFY